MDVIDCMKPSPIACKATDTLSFAATLMKNNDIGFLPVLRRDGLVEGVITDRDIVCRGIAVGKNPASSQLLECMSSPPITADVLQDINACIDLMKERQVKRILITSDNGACCGVVSQKDIAQSAPAEVAGEVSRGLTQPS